MSEERKNEVSLGLGSLQGCDFAKNEEVPNREELVLLES